MAPRPSVLHLWGRNTSAGVPLAARVVVLWTASLTLWSAGEAGALLTTVFNSFLEANEVLALWFAPVALTVDGGMGWERRWANCKELEAAVLQN